MERILSITSAGVTVQMEEGREFREMVDVLQNIAEYTLHIGKFRHSELLMPHDAARVKIAGIDMRVRLEADSLHTCYMYAMQVLREKGSWFIEQEFSYPAMLVYVGRYISRYVYKDIIAAIAHVRDCTLDSDITILYSMPDANAFSNYEVSLILETIRNTFTNDWRLIEALTDNVYLGYTTREVCRTYGIGNHKLNNAKKRLRELLA